MDFRFSPEDEALRQEAIDFTKKEWDPKGYGDGEGIYYGLSWDHENEDLESLINEFEKNLLLKVGGLCIGPRSVGGRMQVLRPKWRIEKEWLMQELPKVWVEAS